MFLSASKDGGDDYHGGPGRDTIDYNGRREPLDVTLDNVANDGETNRRFTVEGDLVRTNVENVLGGSGDDEIVNFGQFSRFEGWAGDDQLFSGNGQDTLIGGTGVDSCSRAAATTSSTPATPSRTRPTATPAPTP